MLAGLNDPSSVSKAGQEVATATGVAYQDVGKVTDAPALPDYDVNKAVQMQTDQGTAPAAASTYVDDKSTVAGQLQGLLASDSPYIQQARDQGAAYSASRGMLNSSAAAGSAQKEAYAAAVPIASQDATTYANAQSQKQVADYQQSQTNMEAIISSEMAKQNSGIAQSAQNIQNQFNAQLQGASEQNKVLLQDFQNTYTSQASALEQQATKLLQTEQISAQKAETIRTQSSAIMQNYQISVENLMTDPDFLNLGSAAMNNAINQMQTLAKNSINFLGSSSGIDLSTYVNAYLKNLAVV